MTLFRGSRYKFMQSFEPNENLDQPYKGLRARPVGPAEGVLEHVIVNKDRLDTLGYYFYGEPRNWYRLAEANPDYLFAEDMIYKNTLDDAETALAEAADATADNGAASQTEAQDTHITSARGTIMLVPSVKEIAS